MPKTKSNEQYIKEATIEHNGFYSYPRTKYTRSCNKVIITCPIHGDFEQNANAHLRGSGCRLCAIELCRVHFTKSNEQYIKEVTIKHNGFYLYHNTEYKGEKNGRKITITCPIHGDFKQCPGHHLRGDGCPKCASEKVNQFNTKTNEQFIKEATIEHNGFYLYHNTEYKGARTPLTITCPIHGDFEQGAGNHLAGHGCPKCKSSMGEESVSMYLKNSQIEYESEKRFKDCRNIKPLPFDFYLPEQNICIEYDGEQHFNPKEFFGGKKGLLKLQRKDAIKTKYCKDNNIKLIRIKYTDYNNIEAILKECIDE